MKINIAETCIGDSFPVYFIADIAANHDGDLERAKHLIHLAKDAGADAAKFQNFQAAKIVSDYGFRSMGAQVSHQSNWNKSVYQVYEEASVPFDWTPILKEECDKVGIHYFSSPYDYEAIDMLESYVPAYKAGSGLITWIDALVYMASKGKPFLMATGASDLGEVVRAVRAVLEVNKEIVLMQCNTNYTASKENFKHLHLNVLKTYKTLFPEVVLGFSDHSPGHSAVLGAVALGARVIEKHFTDDNNRDGPDHKFALNPTGWKEMVGRTRELELALGSRDKFVAENEKETVIVQRRCLRAARDIQAGEVIQFEDIEPLRPAVEGSIPPYQQSNVIGKSASTNIPFGKEIRWTDLKE